MKNRRRIYEGKAKILYEGPEPGTLIQFFKDDATAFNKKKHEVVDGKGVLNNRISEHIFTHLNRMGIPTHFIRRLNMREQLIREVEIIPLEVVVRNVAAGSLSKRLGIEEGTVLPRSIIEFYYKTDALDDPMVSEEHITAFGWASPQEIDDIMALAIRVNDFLSGLFLGVGIQLVDFKIECGRLCEGDMMRIVVADEISPDSLPAVGRRDPGQARQGPLPPRHGRPGRSLPGSRAPPRHHERERAAAPDRPGAGGVRRRPPRQAALTKTKRSVSSVIKARVTVTLKNGVLDPQGKAIEGALGALGFDGVGSVRQGKVFDIELAGNRQGQGRSRAEGHVRQAAGEHGDRELRDLASVGLKFTR